MHRVKSWFRNNITLHAVLATTITSIICTRWLLIFFKFLFRLAVPRVQCFVRRTSQNRVGLRYVFGWTSYSFGHGLTTSVPKGKYAFTCVYRGRKKKPVLPRIPLTYSSGRFNDCIVVPQCPIRTFKIIYTREWERVNVLNLQISFSSRLNIKYTGPAVTLVE